MGVDPDDDLKVVSAGSTSNGDIEVDGNMLVRCELPVPSKEFNGESSGFAIRSAPRDCERP